MTLLGCSTTTGPPAATPAGPPGGSVPNGTEPPYVVITTPLDFLTDGQVVQARGHTFRAGESITVIECAHEVVTDGAKACDPTTVVLATADGDGRFTTAFTVHRTITIGDPRTTIDCGERASRCNVSGAASADPTRSAGTGISFDDRSHDPAPGVPRGSAP